MGQFTDPLNVTKIESNLWRVERTIHWWDECLNDARPLALRCALRVTVPKGFITDFASIPRIFWTLIGHPAGEYVQAAVLHDKLYASKEVSRAKADAIFLAGMKVLGVSAWKRYLLWAAVRAGGAQAYASDSNSLRLPNLVVDPREVSDWVTSMQGELPLAIPANGIGWKRKGQMVAGLIWEPFNSGSNVNVHVACENSMPLGWLVEVFKFLFGHLQVERVSFPIVETNTKAIELAIRLGAVFDHEIRHGHSGGKTVKVYCLWRNTGFHRMLLDAGKL